MIDPKFAEVAVERGYTPPQLTEEDKAEIIAEMDGSLGYDTKTLLDTVLVKQKGIAEEMNKTE